MLEGKVAIVTGAGVGLGKAEALELARLGAKVVVNDLGVTLEGTGGSEDPAHEVVAEIEKNGGEAVAHFGDVADWDYAGSLISDTVDRFGDVHVVVNNAGILRDRMIFNMSPEEFDAVVRVHLRGHFCTVRHACTYWREQGKKTGDPVPGRIINTTSEAALFASAGQPNYAAAKAGIIALTLAAAQGMVKYGVTANAVAPRARTRMTDSAFPGMMDAPEGGFDTFSPDNVTGLVGFLASPAAQRVTGQVFIVWGNQVSVLAGPSVEEKFETEGRWGAEALADALGPFYDKREPLAGYAMPQG